MHMVTPAVAQMCESDDELVGLGQNQRNPGADIDASGTDARRHAPDGAVKFGEGDHAFARGGGKGKAPILNVFEGFEGLGDGGCSAGGGGHVRGSRARRGDRKLPLGVRCHTAGSAMTQADLTAKQSGTAKRLTRR
jgi:hypothetical protein